MKRCWFHKMGNVMNALPASQQARAKAGLQAIWMAATRADAHKAFTQFVNAFQAKYPKAAEKLVKDRDSLLAFYDFPAEHWQHLRTTNPWHPRPATPPALHSCRLLKYLLGTARAALLRRAAIS